MQASLYFVFTPIHPPLHCAPVTKSSLSENRQLLSCQSRGAGERGEVGNSFITTSMEKETWDVPASLYKVFQLVSIFQSSSTPLLWSLVSPVVKPLKAFGTNCLQYRLLKKGRSNPFMNV